MGGGTDIYPYAKAHGGMCLSMAINIRQEIVLDTASSIKGLKYPDGANADFYKAFFNQFDLWPVKMNAIFDGEITGGIGSSAAAAVALVGAIAKAQNIKYDLDEIAQIAWNIEVNKLDLFGGKQDQWAAAHGGVNLFKFGGKFNGGVETIPLSFSFIEPVLPYLMLFHTGKNRKNSKIQEGFKELTEDKIQYLDALKGLVPEAIKAIHKGDIDMFAKLFNLSWEYKKMSNDGVSNEAIELLVSKAKKSGAMALRLTGAGGGGYAIMVVPMEIQNRFKKEMENIGMKWVDFSIDFQGLSVRQI